MNRTFRKHIILLPALLILAAALYFVEANHESPLLYAPSGARAEAVEENTKDVRVEVMPVQAWEVYSSDYASSSWFPATVLVEKNRKLTFKVSGVVANIYIRAGMRLWAEKILVRLDTRENETGIRQLETAFGKARLDSYRAASNYDRVCSLHKTNAATIAEVNAAGVALTKAREAERYYKKQLQISQQTLEYREIKMAEKGIITAVHVNEGDKVEAGQAFASFTPTYPVQVTAIVPAIYLTQIIPDGKARVRFKGASERVYTSFVKEISSASTGPQARYTVTLVLTQAGSAIQSGIPAEVNFRLDPRMNARGFIIPPDALGNDSSGAYVYVVKPTGGDYGTIERRPVSTGPLIGIGQEVTSGLSDGELVVMHGLARLQNGMKVKWK